MQLKCNQYTKT